MDFLDALQSLQTRKPGHHLVEKHKIEGVATTFLNGIGTIADGDHLVAFLLKEDDVGFEKLDLVVYPKQ